MIGIEHGVGPLDPLGRCAERYNFYYTRETHVALTQHVALQAADPELSLDWMDAAVICAAARDQVAGKED